MYKSRTYTKSTMRVTFESFDGQVIFDEELYQPPVKALKKWSKIDQNSQESFDEMSECVAEFLSHNKTHTSYKAEDVIDELDIEDLKMFLKDYFDWLSDVKKN